MNRKKIKMRWSQPARDKIINERNEKAANKVAAQERYEQSEKFAEKKAWSYFKAELKSKSGHLDDDFNTYAIAPNTRDYSKDMTYQHGELIPAKKSDIYYTIEGHRYHC